MGACICCYSEGARVGFVLNAFPSYPASNAQDNTLQKVVGHVVLAGDRPFYAPASGRPCIYFSTIVREQRLHVSYYRDKNGNTHRNVSRQWHVIATASQFQNFYIQDGAHKVFVPGSRGQCRIQSNVGGGRAGVWTGYPPPGIHAMIAQTFERRRQHFWGWNLSFTGEPRDGQPTGQYDYSEESFDVGELVAALGVPVSEWVGTRVGLVTE
jgi:hypothetical protein